MHPVDRVHVISDFHIENLAKTDINLVSEIHIAQVERLLKALTRKLYGMNSMELGKTPGATIDSQITRIFQCPPIQTYPILGKKEGTDAILLGFEPEFEGDRVFAMMYGLYTMALIVSSRTGRLIKQAVHITGMAFLPI